jgi:DNA-directed RNA polymerase subunit RPC12/RpoP
MSYRTTQYRTTPPEDDEEIRCDVCGFGIEGDTTTTTPQTIIQYVREGTVWHHSDPAQVNVKVTVTVPPYTNCPLCGSNRYRDGGRRGTS